MKFAGLFSTLMLLEAGAFAVPIAMDASVTYVSCINSTGFCRIVLDKPVSPAPCQWNDNPVWKVSNQYNKEYNAIALTALTSGKKVIVTTTSECINGHPVIDEIGVRK